MLIGRQTELAEINSALVDHRLVTLTGPGGVGKTAIAREILSMVSDLETHFVDLAPLSSDAITEGVAGSLRFRSFDEMLESLRTRPSMIVLDNCEHVIDAAAAMASDLLVAADGLSILATSREALAVAEEWVLPIRPLDTNGSPSPAEELFLYEAARRGIASPVAAGQDIEELCRRLDGLPLALELAATRLTTLTPREILDDIRVRLDLLARRRVRAPNRHQSLSAAIGWSYATLNADHRKLFAELSVLPSPFTLEAAAAVADMASDAVADGLAVLVERSLLVHEPDQGTSAYRMLETIRMFGAERLNESGSEVESRLRRHALDVAERIMDAAGVADPRVTRLLGQSYRTIRWALLRSIAQDREPAGAVRLAAALWRLEDVGHQSEAADTVEALVDRWPESEDLGPTWGVLAALHRSAGRRDRAMAAAQKAIHYGDALGRAYGLRAAGQFARTDGRWEEARELYAAGVEAALAAGVEAVALEIELHWAMNDARAGDVTGGIARLESVRERAAGFELVDVVCQVLLAWLWLAEDIGTATQIAGDALRSAERIMYRRGVGSAHTTLGLAATSRGDIAGAAEHAAHAMKEFREIRDRTAITLALLLASAVFARAGDLELATAASAARQEHLSGELGKFERALFNSIGAVLDVAATVQSRSLSDLMLRLEQLATCAPARVNRMIVTPDLCTIEYNGSQVQLRTNKGLVDLSTLLSQPGKEIAALDLMGALVVSGDAGPVLDLEARRQYEARIRELQGEIDAATTLGDMTAVEVHQKELDQLAEELSGAYGLGGRARSVGSSAERARSAVTHRIKDAIRRVEAVHPGLASHLQQCVKTGRFCVYSPETSVDWDVVVE